MKMRLRDGLAAAALAVVVAGSPVVFAGPAGAIPDCDLLDDCFPDPDPEPPPTGPGVIVDFHAAAQACEPRMTPTNIISYAAPGATKTVISVSPLSNDVFTEVRVFSGGSPVSFRHQSHGEYRIRSYKPATHVVDTREWYTC
jgi:hypothetical protein